MDEKNWYRKVIEYSDEINDDFAPTPSINQKPIGSDYKFIHTNFIWVFFSYLFYYVLIIPIVFFYMYVLKGLKVKNKQVLKELKKSKRGFFLYGNHTQVNGDAFLPPLLSFPRRIEILINPDTTSIPAIKEIVEMLGAIPLPTGFTALKNMQKAIGTYIDKGRVIAIYPEAHIWPYYNSIRRFKPASCTYPILYNVPAVSFTVTYRQNKLWKKLPPKVTVTLGDIVYPQECADKIALRDKLYNSMLETTIKEKSFAYYQYVKVSPKNENN